ncbi:MAG TPA: Rrf2 family transcriptional regulator [Gammaproteobacteria bacterium]|nr:Rrf2 family transcriptional regulator [Gammaproteobacteria bacterium]
MHLTYHTDYALRVLVYLGLKNGALATMPEISEYFGISRNHLVKVVNLLSRQNLVETQRGKGGGVRLVRDPAEINIGEIVRHAEFHFNIMACFEEGKDHCAIASVCKLKEIFRRAAQGFLEVLDEYTLANVLLNRDDLVEVIFMGDFRISDL